MTKLLVIVGTGPGIGLSTAKLFASQDFSVALLSRNPDRLQEEVKHVQAAGKDRVKVAAFPVDVSDHVALKEALSRVEHSMGKPEIVIFNAARIAKSIIGETTEEDIIRDYKLMNVGQYVTAAWALPLLKEAAKDPARHPSFFLNSSGVSYDPMPFSFSLSMQKSAQNNFLSSLAKVAGPEGVHVGRIDINGVVSDDHPVRNAKHIAEQLWGLYQQAKVEWSFVEDCGTMEELLKATGVESKRIGPP